MTGITQRATSEMKAHRMLFCHRMRGKSYQHILMRLREAYGDGSQHIGFQQDYSNQQQGDKEASDVLAARWLDALNGPNRKYFGQKRKKIEDRLHQMRML